MTLSQPHLWAKKHLLKKKKKILIQHQTTTHLLCTFGLGMFLIVWALYIQLKEFLDNNVLCGNSLGKVLSCFNMTIPLWTKQSIWPQAHPISLEWIVNWMPGLISQHQSPSSKLLLCYWEQIGGRPSHNVLIAASKCGCWPITYG